MSKVALVIMDGWGHGRKDNSNAIYKAHTPFVDSLYQKHPNAELTTYGEAVGLPHGQMGNSEVGHLNIGSGRVVYQELLKINNEIESGNFSKNKVLLETFQLAKDSGKNIHLIGLISDGGVHSHINHLKALCQMAADIKINNLFIHAFTDGRDTDPKSGKGFIKEIEDYCKTTTGTVASLIGRYYAMDRDKRWERIKLAYNLLLKGEGSASTDLSASIEKSYKDGITDEFIKPVVKVKDGKPVTTIAPDDIVLCFNFRTDRCRQLTQVLTQEDIAEWDMQKIPLHYVTMTNYDITFKNVKVVFEEEHIKNTLGEILAENGKTQVRIAETEKYPHVTFFFSGGREEPFNNEKRILIPSPKVATYDLKPEMSAFLVKDAIVKEINQHSPDFICLNFANADMVGHTGVFDAVKKAVETVDICMKELVEICLAKGYSCIILADHGNADYMINEDGSPNTAHTKNPVPVFLCQSTSKIKKIKNGKLADIAPTVLKLMGLKIPKEMAGECLI